MSAWLRSIIPTTSPATRRPAFLPALSFLPLQRRSFNQLVHRRRLVSVVTSTTLWLDRPLLVPLYSPTINTQASMADFRSYPNAYNKRQKPAKMTSNEEPSSSSSSSLRESSSLAPQQSSSSLSSSAPRKMEKQSKPRPPKQPRPQGQQQKRGLTTTTTTASSSVSTNGPSDPQARGPKAKGGPSKAPVRQEEGEQGAQRPSQQGNGRAQAPMERLGPFQPTRSRQEQTDVPQTSSAPGSSSKWAQGTTRPPRNPVSNRWKAAVWSKAGVSTTVLLRDRFTKRTLLFDCGGMGGVSPGQMAEADIVFVSHAHADHCGGLFAHARSRFAAQHAAKYLVPKSAMEQMLVAKKAFEEMDGHELKMEFVEVEPGVRINIGKGLIVECVPTEHRVPSVGYLIYRSEKHVKPEYASLSAEEKAELGRAGVKLSEATEVLEISYSGDTTAQGLDPRIFQAQLAIVECTFITEREAHLAQQTQHVLLSELEQVVAGSNANPDCQLLLMHFSARYSASQITRAVRAAQLLPKRTACALAAFSYDPGATDDDSGITYA